MLKLSMTYETVTPESAEHGEADETGFKYQNEPTTAHDLARLITRDGFNVPSESRGVPRWLTSEGDACFHTGAVENRSIHPGRDAQSQRVWAQVLRICGVAK